MVEINKYIYKYISISVENKIYTVAREFKEIHLTSVGACLVGF